MLIFLRRRLGRRCRFPWDRCQAPATSVVVSDPSDASSIPRPPPTPPSLSLSPRDLLPLPTPPPLLSIPWACKHTAASAITDVFSGASSLLIPPPTPPSWWSIPRAHLSLTMPPTLTPIPQACHCNATASAVFPESSPPPLSSLIPWTHRLFLVLHRRLHRCRRLRGPVSERLLTFGLLNSFFVW